ncbi:ovomucoid-like [Xenopus laevis]|uniref:Kazal-like domain-containing protein n=2 Tax=Xenopus laevis TaxID=8355 RepID=A0A974DAC3_XENLA|nr:ovomucoid-like [Xenopus laevis]OCT87700.1 hypothetical protein XELAEV_18021398mg [Xenopus laevis]
MKAAALFVLIAAVVSNFAGIRSYQRNTEIDCSVYPKINDDELACTKENKPLCGTDGVSYDNACMLCVANLKQKSNIGVRHKGPCKIRRNQINCDTYKKRGQDDLMCAKDYKPVCGTDEESYGNKCLLCAARLKKKTNIYIKNAGPCPFPGYKVDCSKFMKSEDVEMLCTRELNQMCGTDGVTYTNACQLCAAAQKKKTDIFVKHKGSCSIKGQMVDCSIFKDVCTLEYRPHCGSDGLSYGNKCSYCIAQNKNSKLRFLFEGSCYP